VNWSKQGPRSSAGSPIGLRVWTDIPGAMKRSNPWRHGRGRRRPGAAILVVGPHTCCLGPLQEQGDPPASPGFRDDHIALLPGRAFPVPDPRKAVDRALVLTEAPRSGERYVIPRDGDSRRETLGRPQGSDDPEPGLPPRGFHFSAALLSSGYTRRMIARSSSVSWERGAGRSTGRSPFWFNRFMRLQFRTCSSGFGSEGSFAGRS